MHPLRLLRLANPLVRAILRSRAHALLSRRLLLLRTTGPSGRLYEIPLRYARPRTGAADRRVDAEAKLWWRSFARPRRLSSCYCVRAARRAGAVANDRTVTSALARYVDVDARRARDGRRGSRRLHPERRSPRAPRRRPRHSFHLFTAPGDYAGRGRSHRDAILERAADGRDAARARLGRRQQRLAPAGALHVHARRPLAADARASAARSARLRARSRATCGRSRLGRTFDAVFVHDAVMYLATEDDLRACMAPRSRTPGRAASRSSCPTALAETFAPGTDHGGHDARRARAPLPRADDAPDRGARRSRSTTSSSSRAGRRRRGSSTTTTSTGSSRSTRGCTCSRRRGSPRGSSPASATTRIASQPALRLPAADASTDARRPASPRRRGRSARRARPPSRRPPRRGAVPRARRRGACRRGRRRSRAGTARSGARCRRSAGSCRSRRPRGGRARRPRRSRSAGRGARVDRDVRRRVAERAAALVARDDDAVELERPAEHRRRARRRRPRARVPIAVDGHPATSSTRAPRGRAVEQLHGRRRAVAEAEVVAGRDRLGADRHAGRSRRTARASGA